MRIASSAFTIPLYDSDTRKLLEYGGLPAGRRIRHFTDYETPQSSWLDPLAGAPGRARGGGRHPRAPPPAAGRSALSPAPEPRRRRGRARWGPAGAGAAAGGPRSAPPASARSAA